MASIKDLREAIADRLGTIQGLTASPYVPHQLNTPHAFVVPRSIDYDETFNRGDDAHRFEVHILVAASTDRSAQQRLDEFLASASVKDTLEEPEIDGAENLRVERLESYGIQTLAGADYYGATFIVFVPA